MKNKVKSPKNQQQIKDIKPTDRPFKCHRWLQPKQRYCGMSRQKDSVFCSVHTETDKHGNPQRVPCPYTISHTVGIHEYDRHLKTCPSKPKPNPPYFKLDCNQLHPRVPTRNAKDRLHKMTIIEFQSIMERIQSLYLEVCPTDFELDVKTHQIMADRLIETHQGKHAVQQASIIGHLEHHNLLRNDVTFVEFGCGSAELTKYVHFAVGNPALTILVDRKAVKLKVHKSFKLTPWDRFLIDIKDLNLSKAEKVNDQPAVIYSKHLCGSATDLTLRCLENYLSDGGKVQGLAIAMCCHQVCEYERYINHTYLNKHSITKDEFELLAVISTWAVCGIIDLNQEGYAITIMMN
ncbi:methyltransferase TRM13-domain-containing protein [Globomyces pollinis-pini]|nr:methyltransferase TRM13-domain-containing protein [Globomyces pollinis-pini]